MKSLPVSLSIGTEPHKPAHPRGLEAAAVAAAAAAAPFAAQGESVLVLRAHGGKGWWGWGLGLELWWWWGKGVRCCPAARKQAQEWKRRELGRPGAWDGLRDMTQRAALNGG